MGEEQVERRLAAILAADVVGYSRLMEANEERTMGALRLHRREFFDPTVAKHAGRIFKVMGDGVNLAARLESLAGPGDIACSAMVRNQIGNKLELEFLDQGEKMVKNITQPVHVYFVNLGLPTNGAALTAPGHQPR